MEEILKKEDFYISLAHLFYAISAIDHRIEFKEKEKIKELVEDHWAFNVDHSGSQEIIYSTLKKLFTEKTNARDSLSFFSNFYLQNRNLFKKDLEKIILKDLSAIALAFSELNKSESLLISEIYFLMNNNK